jgi:hypothetical protein
VILLFVGLLLLRRSRSRGAAQRLIAANGASGCQGLRDKGSWIVSSRGEGFLQLALGTHALAAIAGFVVIGIVEVVFTVLLALAAGGREEALFALAAAAHTRWLVRIVDGAQVAADLAAL